MQYQLTAVSGPTKGACWNINEEGLILGRTSDCDVVVPDASVSRRHCRFFCEGQALQFEDIGGRNPVLVNGEPASRCQLNVGDELAIGRFQFLVVGAAEPHHQTSPSDSDTHSGLPDGEAFLLSTDRQELWKRQKPRTLRDLATLYDIACELGCSDGMCDLLDRACRRIRERFNPVGLWIVRVEERNEFTLLAEHTPKGQTSKAALPREVLTSAIEKRSGVAVPKRRRLANQTQHLLTLAAPLVFGEVVHGALAVQVESPASLFDESDLRFVVLLAQSLAPLIGAMETVEQLHRDNERLRSHAAEGFDLLGDSRAIAHVRKLIATAARSHLNVLITGETGTGKELAARMVHVRSDRCAGPFVVVNCAAIPKELFENELFGHEQGAYTGAERTSPGLIDQANFGTLFLDEVGDLSAENQARILRVVEYGTYRRVGGQQELQVDIRVVSATNKDVRKGMKQGQFREDLFQRLSGFEICMPPLRERPSDVELLAEHFFRMGQSRAKHPLRRITPEALGYLRTRQWPGNVRELRNMVLRAVASSPHEEVTIHDLALTQEVVGTTTDAIGDTLSLAEVERRHIEAVLRRCDGHVGRTAQMLGIARSTLYEKLADYHIPR